MKNLLKISNGVKKIFLITFLVFIFLSLAPVQAKEEGLVTCGGSGQDPCTLCDFFQLFKKIIDFLLLPPDGIVPIIATLMLVIGGIMFFFAGGSPEGLQKAKRLITSVVVGLIIVYCAWIFVNFVLTFSGFINPDLDWNPENWFQIECSVQ